MHNAYKHSVHLCAYDVNLKITDICSNAKFMKDW